MSLGGSGQKKVIGLDFGTLSARGVLIGIEDGKVHSEVSYRYPHGVMDYSLPSGKLLSEGSALAHPDDYIAALFHCLRALVKDTAPGEIAGIGLDATTYSMVPCQSNGEAMASLPAYYDEPMAYIKLWKHHCAQSQASRIQQVQQQTGGIPGLSALLAQPNAALALEYLAALPGAIVPVPIPREGAGYHDEALVPLSSATAVRAALSQGRLSDALAAVPCPELIEEAERSGAVHDEEALTQALLYRLRTMDADALAAIAGMDEGVHNRFLAAARTAATRDELILAVKSKRYTYARLSRIATNALLGVTADFARTYARPTCARVLGFRKGAQPLLSEIKRRTALPLVTRIAGIDDPLLALDVRAQDLWALGCQSPALRAAGQDYTAGPVIA